MKYKVVFLFIILFLSHLSAQQILSLEECIHIALKNNNSIKQQELTNQSRKIAYDQSRQSLLPNLNVFANQNFAFGRTQVDYDKYENVNSRNTALNVSSSLALFNGFRMKHNITANRMNLYASEADMAKIESDVTINVITAYLSVLMNKELQTIAENQIEITQSRIREQRILVEAGKVPEGELYEILAQEAKEELSRIEAENLVRLSLLELSQILEILDFESIDVTYMEDIKNVDLPLLSSSSVFENAVISRPEIKAAEYRLKSSKIGVLIARSGYYPNLSVSGNLGSTYFYPDALDRKFDDQFSNNFNSSIGINLSIPIFNRMEIRNSVKNAMIDMESYKLQMQNTKLELRKIIEQSYLNAVAAKSRWEAANKSEKASREAYRFANEKYESGFTTQYDLFNAKNNLAQVLSEQTHAKYEYIFRIKILSILNGDLSY